MKSHPLLTIQLNVGVCRLRIQNINFCFALSSWMKVKEYFVSLGLIKCFWAAFFLKRSELSADKDQRHITPPTSVFPNHLCLTYAHRPISKALNQHNQKKKSAHSFWDHLALSLMLLKYGWYWGEKPIHSNVKTLNILQMCRHSTCCMFKNILKITENIRCLNLLLFVL